MYKRQGRARHGEHVSVCRQRVLAYRVLVGVAALLRVVVFEERHRKMCIRDSADVLYMLMPDRFASSGKNLKVKGLNAYTVNREEPSLRHGGDLEGIRQHLDYFNELGVTALWFTPVLENNSPEHDSSRS